MDIPASLVGGPEAPIRLLVTTPVPFEGLRANPKLSCRAKNLRHHCIASSNKGQVATVQRQLIPAGQKDLVPVYSLAQFREFSRLASRSIRCQRPSFSEWIVKVVPD